jgi:sec-independent protein translocase protein TatB
MQITCDARSICMLGIGMQEIIIILVVALIIIGPKKLPDLARALGRAMGEFRKAADDLKDNLDINGMKAEKEKLLRELTQTNVSKDKKPKKDKKTPETEPAEKGDKDPELNG